MEIYLTDRVQRIKPSATLAVAGRAEALKAAGKDIISLGTGEPDFDTPEHIKEAAIQAMRDGLTKYTDVAGTLSLRKAICEKFSNENGLSSYTPEQVLVSCGAKHSIFNLLLAVIQQGDEVIIPAPYWVSYPDMVLLSDGVPVIVPTTIEQNFKITAAQLEQAITPKTRLLIINSPSNPTGMTYSLEELEALGAVLAKYPQVTIASDDIYEHILWTAAPFVNILNACPELIDRTVVINGVSKAYAMTGWRIGYAAGPSKLIAAMKKIQSQSTSNPCSIAQAAAQAALQGDQSCVVQMNLAFKERHDYFYRALNEIDSIDCLPADGAFYLFPSVQKAIDNNSQVLNDVDFADYLLDKAEVAVVPGSAFGAPGCIRLSFATSFENLLEAIKRINSVV
ncbi:pyridoxal phosphate-dependent aminotransferase [soil metagenome]